MYNNWEELEKQVKDCKKCKLCMNRTNVVFGVGNKNAKIKYFDKVQNYQILNKEFEIMV